MRDYILVITMHADPVMPPGYNEWGGTHKYMKELLDSFQENQTPCIMITRKSMRQLSSIESFNNYCTIYRLTNGNNEPMNKIFLKKYHQQNVQMILDILSQQHTPPRIIHSVYWNSGRLAMEISQQLNIPFVHSIISNSRGRVLRGAHEPIPERAEYEQQIYTRAAKLICVSKDEGDDLINLYNVPPEKIVVAGQFIEPSFIMPARDCNGFPRLNSRITPDVQKEIAAAYNEVHQMHPTVHYWTENMFTYLGRMDINKGLDYIFKAWYRLYGIYGNCCPGLWLVGGSLKEIETVRQCFKYIASDLEDLERLGKILWWGYLDPVGVSTVFLKTRVLITHSLYEPGGRVAVEAMSEGLPVIATPNGFAKDTIQDWQEGFLVSYGDDHTLSLRMEHFIRQPYLSSALGMNAKKKALKVVESWNFWGRHLACYNSVLLRESCTDEEQPLHDFFQKRKIDYFPYTNKPFSQELVASFFTQCTGQQAYFLEQANDKDCTSDIFRLAGENSTYIVKRIYTRLSISPLLNPICSNEYVRSADRQYRTEVTAYKRTESPVLVGADDLHYLLLLRELEPYPVRNKEDLSTFLQYLLTRPNTLTTKEAEIFFRIIESPKDSISHLENLLYLLNAELNDYYFEVSGIFSQTLCWSIAPHLLDYNSRALSHSIREQLVNCAQCFRSYRLTISKNRLRPINTDMELRHICHSDGNICMIDLEKVSIGTIETDIAGIFYNFLMCNGDDGSFWPWAIDEILRLKDVDLPTVLSCTAYRFFYESIVRSVLDRHPPAICIQQLELLMQLFEDIIL